MSLYLSHWKLPPCIRQEVRRELLPGRGLRDRLRLCGRHLQRAGPRGGEVRRGVPGELGLQHPPGPLLQADQETQDATQEGGGGDNFNLGSPSVIDI